MKNVTITANPTTGKVFTPNAKPGKDGKIYGFIRVESVNIDFSGAVARTKMRSALKSMLASDFEMANKAGLLTAGSKLDGHIVRQDSTTPSYEGQPCVQIPLRDEANNIIPEQFRDLTSNGQKVYRNEFFTDKLEIVDSLLSYDKVEATVAPIASSKAIA